MGFGTDWLICCPEQAFLAMGRGKYYNWWRRIGERLEAVFYQENWAARLAHTLKLQGQLQIDRRDFFLPIASGTRIKLAFISDLHAGPLTDSRLFEAVFNVIDMFAPDVILFGGDYVSLHERHITRLTSQLSRLVPDVPKFAVMGNHDLWLDDKYIVMELQKAGVQVLVNESRFLHAPLQSISICGLDEPGIGNPDAAAMFADTGNDTCNIRLVLMHSPLGLKHIDKYVFNIAFCGHTHGGQIAMPGGRPLLLPPGSGERRYASGLFKLPQSELLQDRYLLTSRGIGMSDLPVRLFAPSEIHLCCLHSIYDHIATLSNVNSGDDR